MADSLQRSRYRLTYMYTDERTGARHRIVLCRFRSLLSSPVTISGQPVIQTDNIVDSDWIRMVSRGNASVTLSVAVMTVWESMTQAELYGDDLHLWMLTHPVGRLLVEAYPDYVTGEPTRVRLWQAATDTAGPAPMSRELWQGRVLVDQGDGRSVPAAAWLQMSYKFRLTRPQPGFMPLPADTINDILL